MHSLEPYFNWRHLYLASEDPKSPFFGYQNSEVYFTHAIYDHVIHPQWDSIGSDTLFVKQLYTDYEDAFVIIELIGEWNDCIENDIMRLKRDYLEDMLAEGINKFIMVGENVLNFHPSDDCYYEEWFEEVEEGWIAFINFQEHVLREMKEVNLDYYINWGGKLDEMAWRRLNPLQFFQLVELQIQKRLGA